MHKMHSLFYILYFSVSLNHHMHSVMHIFAKCNHSTTIMNNIPVIMYWKCNNKYNYHNTMHKRLHNYDGTLVSAISLPRPVPASRLFMASCYDAKGYHAPLIILLCALQTYDHRTSYVVVRAANEPHPPQLQTRIERVNVTQL